MILFSILFMYILIEGVPVFSPCFLKYAQNILEDTEYLILSVSSNLSLHVRPDILNLLFLYDSYIFSIYSKCWDLLKQHIYHFSLLFKFVSSKRLSNSLWGSDGLLFHEFINIVSILFYNFVKLIILLYTFLVISFAWYKKYIWFHLLSFQM